MIMETHRDLTSLDYKSMSQILKDQKKKLKEIPLEDIIQKGIKDLRVQIKSTQPFLAVRKLREKIFKVQNILNQERENEENNNLKLAKTGERLHDLKFKADKLLEKVILQRKNIENKLM